MTLLCANCGQPHMGDGRRMYCLTCRPIIRAATLRRAAWTYAHTEKGRATRLRHRHSDGPRRYFEANRERIRAWGRRYSQSEKGKRKAREWVRRSPLLVALRQERYWERNRTRILARRKELRKQKWPQARTCDTILCGKTFLVGPRQGHKLYCDLCIGTFYGPSRIKVRAA